MPPGYPSPSNLDDSISGDVHIKSSMSSWSLRRACKRMEYRRRLITITERGNVSLENVLDIVLNCLGSAEDVHFEGDEDAMQVQTRSSMVPGQWYRMTLVKRV